MIATECLRTKTLLQKLPYLKKKKAGCSSVTATGFGFQPVLFMVVMGLARIFHEQINPHKKLFYFDILRVEQRQSLTVQSILFTFNSIVHPSSEP